MYVRTWMSRDVITARMDEDIADAVALMKKHNIRRLPVLDAEDRVAGIVTLLNLCMLLPLEHNPLKEDVAIEPTGVTVGEVMERNVPTVTPNQSIEDVASIMRANRATVMPVVDRGRMVGIVTESDVFDAMACAFGAGQGGVRITFDLPDDPKALVKVAQAMRTFAITVLNMTLYHTEDEERETFTLRVQGKDVDRFVQSLWKMGCRVLGVKDEEAAEESPEEP